MKPQPSGVQGMQPWKEPATGDGASHVEEDASLRRDSLDGTTSRRGSLASDGPRGSDRLHLPSLRAETGAVLERQLLLSGSPAEGSELQSRSSWTVRLGMLVVIAALAGCAVLLYNHMERRWHAQISDLRSDVAQLDQDRRRIARENEEKTRILVAKIRENENLAAAAAQTLTQLNETMRELRKERNLPAAPAGEAAKPAGFDLRGFMAGAVKLLCRVIPEQWKKGAETRADER